MPDLEIQQDVPLAPLTTFELGGPARFFVRAGDTETLISALRWAREEGHKAAVLGGGSNLIVPDEGYRGLVIQMAIGDIDFKDGGTVEVGAGVPWEVVVDGAVTRGWAGLECLTGIPGSTGATPIQNVGAYGQEVAEVIERVLVVDLGDLSLAELAPEACEFGYRDSMFKREPERYIVLGVHFALRPDGPATIRYSELEKRVSGSVSLGEIRNAVLDLRRKKSMVIDPDDPNRRSAGSFFLNPVVTSTEADRVAALAVAKGVAPNILAVPRYPTPSGDVKLAAGWLIEKSGIAKGTRRGAVGVSSNHALVLVHHGEGTTTELLAFGDEIRARVEDRFGLPLEREPRLLA
ncbi:MAG: UDP-N-acetylmuramate dehydrogenase [Myxococcales bacterium]|nr:UDP-N-acetylmuramate dehydrogenase [Myxococcales bacterium]